jgi:hypothetical protein
MEASFGSRFLDGSGTYHEQEGSMKVLLVVIAAGFVVKLSFSAIMTHWFPRPDPHRPAWNIAKEAAMDQAGVH